MSQSQSILNFNALSNEELLKIQKEIFSVIESRSKTFLNAVSQIKHSGNRKVKTDEELFSIKTQSKLYEEIGRSHVKEIFIDNVSIARSDSMSWPDFAEIVLNYLLKSDVNKFEKIKQTYPKLFDVSNKVRKARTKRILLDKKTIINTDIGVDNLYNFCARAVVDIYGLSFKTTRIF
jgi:hypothetical protein